jgi:predicted protein tyrosine phosphatase
MPWTLAACLAESIEMLFPLSDFMPAWPWQARQLSSCLSGCGKFACALARACAGEPSERRPAKRIKARKKRPNRRIVRVVRRIFSRKPRLQSSQANFVHSNLEGFEEKVP